MKHPTILNMTEARATPAQKAYMQTTATYEFFRRFISEVYGYTVMYTGLSVARGATPPMLMDEATTTVNKPGVDAPVSIHVLNGQLAQATGMFGEAILAHPVSLEDPLFQHQRQLMANAWGTDITFVNLWVNGIARGIDVRFGMDEKTREAVVLNGAYASWQYLEAILPKYVDHYDNVEAFVDAFLAHAEAARAKPNGDVWPVVFNSAILATLFVDPMYGSAIELYNIYTNVLRTATDTEHHTQDWDLVRNTVTYSALSHVG